MDILVILIAFFVLFIFTAIPIKISANILNIEGATIGVCIIAVILSIIASILATLFIGEGVFPSVIAFIITGIFFSWLFKTNTVTGFVLAGISIGVQLILTFFIAGLGYALI
ncbi:hypothetical protein [Psychromonas sp. SP041]|uniref:hypothetical protein n=1 Tax=Psychromonas sp. SP041 TaxID=1365007 RepID=UPI0010C7A4DE|nr:hypothetical protein [Psychromonas sp. SP041]